MKERKVDVHLTFGTCGGFSNQLLSIAFVLTYAVVREVDVVVSPSMIMNGRQISGVDEYPDTRTSSGFGQVFDWSTAYTFLRRSRILLVPPEEWTGQSGNTVLVCGSDETLDQCTQKVERCKSKAMTGCHVHMQCPFIHRIWDVTFLKQHNQLFEEVLNSLTPSKAVKRMASSAIDKITRRTDSADCVTFVHLRVEMDWREHCKSWLPAIAKDASINCMVNVPEVIDHLHQLNVSHCTIVIAYDSDDVDVISRQEIQNMKLFRGITVIDLNDILPTAEFPREIRAGAAALIAIEEADFFVGNSVSTLSATIIRQRRQKRLWAAQYNRGAIPLSEFIPGFSIAWVFALRGKDKRYDEMMKVAVKSALQQTSLIPYVMVHPDESRYDRVQWLRSQGVQVCIHQPTWELKLLEILKRSTESARKSSHLYSFPDMVLGTFFRLDIAVLPELLQFEHVLYTDTDVLFNKDITDMQGEGLKLPSTIQLSIETPNLAVLNAGVYFASLRFLRETHAGLIQALLSSKSIDYGVYGPGDQGLLNMYYEAGLKKAGLLSEELFNAKAYSTTIQARIVHFHGPKPSDYEEAVRKGSCTRFPVLCDQGVKSELFCRLFNTWIQHCVDECLHYPYLRERCRKEHLFLH